jgi:parallel beta-helix repeat protein
VYHCGDSGISLAGGERETLTPGRHRAADNHIHHIGEWSRSYQPGIRVQGVGQRLEHNHIHDGPHNGILLSGNEHIIEYNHIHHVCQESGDVGAFYMGRDWTECGNVLRYNFFHHTQGVGMGSMAVYLDDCASSTTIFGNIFYQCTRAVFIGGGRNNRVENNIFIDCQPALQIDGRGLDPKPVWRHMVDHTMKERLDAMNYREPPYKTRYPDLKQLAPYYAEEVAIPPEGNLVVRNICCGPWIDIHWHANRKMIAIQNNMIDEDPLFVDREGMDFQLRVDSPAYEIGFKRIPVDKIGTRDNP